MRSLNLDQLRALIEVVELGSFSAAARRLNLTQPAVSLQIRELEKRVDVLLVRRIGKRAYATPAGRELIEHANGIFDSTNRAMSAMRRHKEGGLGAVHVGCGSAALTYLVLPVLQRLRREHPTIELAVTTGSTSDITERISRNAVDLGFTGLPVDASLFDATIVRDMALVAILPSGDGDAPGKMTAVEIARRQLILSPPRSNYALLAREWLRAAGLEVRPAMEIDNIEAIKAAVAAGFGVALIPEVAISRGPSVEGLVVRPLDPPLALPLGIIRRRNQPDDPAARIVHDALLALAE
jgi:DNA-binding transcriptional LysR family regulator